VARASTTIITHPTRRQRLAASLASGVPLLLWLRRLRRAAMLGYFARSIPECGANLVFDPDTALFVDREHLRVGSNVYIGPAAYFVGPISIGDDVLIAPNVSILATYHEFMTLGQPIRASGQSEAEGVVVEDDVWLGYGTTLMRGVRIGQGAVVGARSLVIDSVPPYVVAAGSPCRPIRLRFTDTELLEHLRLRGMAPADAEMLIQERRRALADHSGSPGQCHPGSRSTTDTA
jgi:chloramphenicol O-acetyltransferase type B